MLTGISNPFGTEMQTASAVLLTAGLIAGRKFCLAAGCKLGSKVAGFVNEQKASQLDQAGNRFLTLGKKDALRDFAAVTGLVAVVGLAKCANDLSANEPKEEVDYFQSYAMPTLKYGSGAVIAGLGLRSLIRYSMDSTYVLPLYSKCHQLNGQAETMGNCKLPLKLVTSATIKIMDKFLNM